MSEPNHEPSEGAEESHEHPDIYQQYDQILAGMSEQAAEAFRRWIPSIVAGASHLSKEELEPDIAHTGATHENLLRLIKVQIDHLQRLLNTEGTTEHIDDILRKFFSVVVSRDGNDRISSVVIDESTWQGSDIFKKLMEDVAADDRETILPLRTDMVTSKPEEAPRVAEPAVEKVREEVQSGFKAALGKLVPGFLRRKRNR